MWKQKSRLEAEARVEEFKRCLLICSSYLSQDHLQTGLSGREDGDRGQLPC